MPFEEIDGMATFNPASQRSNPAPLGFAAPVAGTPVNVCANFTDLTGAQFQSLSIQASVANTGTVYILSNSSAADTTNGTNIIGELQAGQSLPFSGLAQGGITPSQFWIDVSATGNKAIPIVYTA